MTVQQTYYTIYFNEPNYGKAGLVMKTSNYYWVASRYVKCNTGTAYFGIRFANDAIWDCYLYNSGTGQDGSQYTLRPVVTLDYNMININAGKDDNGVWKLK